MTRPQQLRDEEHYMRLFVQHCPPAQGATVNRLQPPEPDFCLEFSNKHVGVEITEFVGSRRERRVEGTQDSIVRRARELYVESGAPAVDVLIYWSAFHTASTAGDGLARWLAETVRSSVPELDARTEVARSTLSPSATLAGHPNAAAFDTITITRIADGSGDSWFSPRSWWVAQAEPAVVQAEIDRKSGKPAAYRGTYADRWLVLVHRGSQPSSAFEIPVSTRHHIYHTPYDRVWVFGLTPLELWEVRRG